MLIAIPHGDTTIRAEDSGGKGRPLLLLHGALLSRESLLGLLPGLQAVRRCVIADLPGHGASRYQGAIPDSITVASLTRGIEGLLEHLGGDVDVIGESMGGVAALAIAAQRSPLIHSLTLLGVVPDAELAEHRQPYLALADQLAAGGWTDDILAVPRSIYLSVEAQADVHPDGPPARLRRIISGNDPRNAAAVIRGSVARPDQSSSLAGIRCPTHVIIPEKDVILAPIRQQAMATAIPGSCTTTIPGAGHCAGLERPQAVVRAILGFPSTGAA